MFREVNDSHVQALAEATAWDVPILLSVGYSSCHWCHVMVQGTSHIATSGSKLVA
nr:DUF255 domain-containing protein [Nocardia australiensis]